MNRVELRALLRRSDELVARIEHLKSDIATEVDKIITELTTEALQATTVDGLRPYLRKGARVSGLKSSRYRTAADIFQATPAMLAQIPGVGPQSAEAIHSAAKSKAEHERSAIRIRLDPDNHSVADSRLTAKLVALHKVEALGKRLEQLIQKLRARIDPLSKDERRFDSRVRMFFSGAKRKEAAREAAAKVDEIASDPALAEIEELANRIEHDLPGSTASPLAVWADYAREAAAINSLLSEFTSGGVDLDAAHGYASSAIVSGAEAVTLDTSQLKARLRGYQKFGAQYVLSRRRVILGDEMGLGKTVQALAVAAHLSAAEDARHFLVVCPASVVINWANEAVKHTQLEPFEIIGPQRNTLLQKWRENGGIAITTFGTLQRLSFRKHPQFIIVDEAHYLKNPSTQRSRAVRDLLHPNDRAMFLSGTPMENRIDEFRNLIEYLQPHVVDKLDFSDGHPGPVTFRKTVAPAYLRRNQSDVLTELPELIETEEWVRFNGADAVVYRDAVMTGNFMAIRQAAYLANSVSQSAKLERLTELVTEAHANGAKVIVFSFFLKVLESIQKSLPGKVFGPLTGSLAAPARQTLVDNFTNHRGAATLLSQIEAGGVGLNIQTASVVIITEPQWKPSIEAQAVARAHRMGQLRTVQVHRILAKDSIDEPIRELVLSKAGLFDEYARKSHAKDTNPDAVDGSWAHADKQRSPEDLVRSEQARLSIEGVKS